MKQTYNLFLVLFTFSCSSPDGNLYEIDPRKFVENKVMLAEIADGIIYIPLDNSFPIGMTFGLKFKRDYIYLSVKDVGIVQFDRNGKLVRKIGSIGRGPGEFRYGMEFAVDERSGNIFVLDPNIVKVYSQSGIFIRDILLKGYAGGFGFRHIEIYNSLLFFPDYLPKGDSKNSWVFLDTLGNLVAKKKNSVPTFETNIEMKGSIYEFENKLFYFNYFNDTIFVISPDFSYRGAYLFAQGDHRWPRARIETNPKPQFISQLYKLFKPVRMFETKHFIVLEYTYLDRWALTLIDKKTKETFLALKYEETPESIVKSKASLINDLDGGLPLSGYIYYYVENENEYIVQLINPFDLKSYVSSSEFKNSVPKDPEKKRELEKLAISLKETDNPVLMMVRLKK